MDSTVRLLRHNHFVPIGAVAGDDGDTIDLNPSKDATLARGWEEPPVDAPAPRALPTNRVP